MSNTIVCARRRYRFVILDQRAIDDTYSLCHMTSYPFLLPRQISVAEASSWGINIPIILRRRRLVCNQRSNTFQQPGIFVVSLQWLSFFS